jgi:hypothetical protein
MLLQDLATIAIVFAAAAYLVWKLGWHSRPKRRKAPDVPLRQLRRGKKR